MNDSDVYISKRQLLNYLEEQLDLYRFCLAYETGVGLTDEQLETAEAILLDVIEKVNRQPVFIQTGFGVSRSGLVADKPGEPSACLSQTEK